MDCPPSVSFGALCLPWLFYCIFASPSVPCAFRTGVCLPSRIIFAICCCVALALTSPLFTPLPANALYIDAGLHPDGTTLTDLSDGSVTVGNLQPGWTLTLVNITATSSCNLQDLASGTRLTVVGLTTNTLNLGDVPATSHLSIESATVLYTVTMPHLVSVGSFRLADSILTGGAVFDTVTGSSDVVLENVTAVSTWGDPGLEFVDVTDSKLSILGATFEDGLAGGPGGHFTGLAFKTSVTNSTLVFTDIVHEFDVSNNLATFTFGALTDTNVTLHGAPTTITADSLDFLTFGTSQNVRFDINDVSAVLSVTSDATFLRWSGCVSCTLGAHAIVADVVATGTTKLLHCDGLADVTNVLFDSVSITATVLGGTVNVVAFPSGVRDTPTSIALSRLSLSATAATVNVLQLGTLTSVPATFLSDAFVNVTATTDLDVFTLATSTCSVEGCTLSANNVTVTASQSGVTADVFSFGSFTDYGSLSFTAVSLALSHTTADPSPVARALVFTAAADLHCALLSSVSVTVKGPTATAPGFAAGLQALELALTQLSVSLEVQGAVAGFRAAAAVDVLTMIDCFINITCSGALCAPTGLNVTSLSAGPSATPSVLITGTRILIDSPSPLTAIGIDFGSAAITDVVMEHSSVAVQTQGIGLGVRFQPSAVVAGTLHFGHTSVSVAALEVATGIEYGAPTLSAVEASHVVLTATSTNNQAAAYVWLLAINVTTVRFVDSSLAATAPPTKQALGVIASTTFECVNFTMSNVTVTVGGDKQTSGIRFDAEVFGIASFVIESCRFLVPVNHGVGLRVDLELRRSATAKADTVVIRDSYFEHRSPVVGKRTILKADAKIVAVRNCTFFGTMTSTETTRALDTFLTASLYVLFHNNTFRTAATTEGVGLMIRSTSPTDAPSRIEVTDSVFDVQATPVTGIAIGVRDASGMSGDRVLVVSRNDFSMMADGPLAEAIFTAALGNRMVLNGNTFPPGQENHVISREIQTLRCNYFAGSPTPMTGTQYLTGENFTTLPCETCPTVLCDKAPGFSGSAQISGGLCECDCGGEYYGLPLLQTEACVTAPFWPLEPSLIVDEVHLSAVKQRTTATCVAVVMPTPAPPVPTAPPPPAPTRSPTLSQTQSKTQGLTQTATLLSSRTASIISISVSLAASMSRTLSTTGATSISGTRTVSATSASLSLRPTLSASIEPSMSVSMIQSASRSSSPQTRSVSALTTISASTALSASASKPATTTVSMQQTRTASGSVTAPLSVRVSASLSIGLSRTLSLHQSASVSARSLSPTVTQLPATVPQAPTSTTRSLNATTTAAQSHSRSSERSLTSSGPVALPVSALRFVTCTTVSSCPTPVGYVQRMIPVLQIPTASASSGVLITVAAVGDDMDDIPPIHPSWLTVNISGGQGTLVSVTAPCPRFSVKCRVVLPCGNATGLFNVTASQRGVAGSALLRVVGGPAEQVTLSVPSESPWPANPAVLTVLHTNSTAIITLRGVGTTQPVSSPGAVATVFVEGQTVDLFRACVTLRNATVATMTNPSVRQITTQPQHGHKAWVRLPFRVPDASSTVLGSIRRSTVVGGGETDPSRLDCGQYASQGTHAATVSWSASSSGAPTDAATTQLHDCALAVPTVSPAAVVSTNGTVVMNDLVVRSAAPSTTEGPLSCRFDGSPAVTVPATRTGPCTVRCFNAAVVAGLGPQAALTVSVMDGQRRTVVGSVAVLFGVGVAWLPPTPAIRWLCNPTSPRAATVELNLLSVSLGATTRACRSLLGLLPHFGINVTLAAETAGGSVSHSWKLTTGFMVGSRCTWRAVLPSQAALAPAVASTVRFLLIASVQYRAQFWGAVLHTASSTHAVECAASCPTNAPMPAASPVTQRVWVSGCLDAYPSTGECGTAAHVAVHSSPASLPLAQAMLLAPLSSAIAPGSAAVLNVSDLDRAVLCGRPIGNTSTCRLPSGATGTDLRVALGTQIAPVAAEAFEEDSSTAIAAFSWTSAAARGTVSLAQRDHCPVGGTPSLACSGHGECVSGVCLCTASTVSGFWGSADCGRCHARYSAAANGSSPCTVRCPGDAFHPCGGHGTCTAGGVCLCDVDHAGSDCSLTCPTLGGAVCNGHGTCSSVCGACACDHPYAGVACGTCAVAISNCTPFAAHGLSFDAAVCPHSPTVPQHQCSGHGACNATTATCACLAGYVGSDCALRCPTAVADAVCSAHGVCGEDATCRCDVGWSGTDCGSCSSDFGGRRCEVRCPVDQGGVVCGPHGTCSPTTGQCDCHATETLGFWSGAACGECQDGYGGANCVGQCPSANCALCGGHGACNAATVTCACNAGWAGAACDRCAPSRFGADCAGNCPTDALSRVCGGHGQCSDGTIGSGVCTCDSGFSQASTCSACTAGFYGPSCAPCGRDDPTGAACSGHGVCADGITGSGACTCSAAWGGSRCSGECGYDGGVLCGAGSYGCGPSGCDCRPGYSRGPSLACDACAPLHFGSSCQQCDVACAAHGTCRDGRGADGGCDCDVGWGGVHCTVQCPSVSGAVCSGHGACTNAGVCQCASSPADGYWAGSDCSQCSTFFAGPGCTAQCPFSNGRVCNGRGRCNSAALCVECSPNTALGDSPTDQICGAVCDVVNACAIAVPATACPGGVSAAPNPGVIPCSAHGWCSEPTAQCHCFAGFLGADCAAPCPPCAATGECVMDGGAPRCQCSAGYFGYLCQGVCPGAGSPSGVCSGHGACNALTGVCSCSVGFGGVSCGVQCAYSDDGALCGGHGACDQATGHCVCDSSPPSAFAGSDCTVCAAGLSGDACDTACVHGVTVGRDCRCFAGYGGLGCFHPCPVGPDGVTPCAGHGLCVEATAQCNCSDAWFGPSCTVQCEPSWCEAAHGWAHGECDPATGSCRCLTSTIQGHWAGHRCDDCAATRWGPSCTAPCMCSGHGTCDRVDGQCQCYHDPASGFWHGRRCTVCASGYVGEGCLTRNLPLSTTASLRLPLHLDAEFDRPVSLAAGGTPTTCTLLKDPSSDLIFLLSVGAASTHLAAIRASGSRRESVWAMHLPVLPGPPSLALNTTHLLLYVAGADAGDAIVVFAEFPRYSTAPQQLSPRASSRAVTSQAAGAHATALVSHPNLGMSFRLYAASGPRRLTPFTPTVAGSLQAVSLRTGGVLYDEPTLPAVYQLWTTMGPNTLLLETGDDVILVAGSAFGTAGASTYRWVWAARTIAFSTLTVPGTTPQPVVAPPSTKSTIDGLGCAAAEMCVPSYRHEVREGVPRVSTTPPLSKDRYWMCVLRCTDALYLASGLSSSLDANAEDTPGVDRVAWESVTKLEAEGDAPIVDIGAGTQAALQQRLLEVLTTRVRLAVTAMAVDEATGRAFVAINDNRRFVSGAALGTRRGGTTLLTVDVARGLVAGVVHRAVSEKVAAMTTSVSDMLLASFVTGQGLHIDSGNLVAVAALSPAVVDSNLGAARLTITGAGFVHSTGSALCLFADPTMASPLLHGRSADAQVTVTPLQRNTTRGTQALDTMVCTIPRLAALADTCAVVDVGIGSAARRVATGIAVSIHPVVTAQLWRAANAVFRGGPPLVRVGRAFSVTLHGAGFVQAERAVCRVTDAAGKQHTFAAFVDGVTDSAVCRGTAPPLPSTPPALLQYSHDGVVFSDGVPFAFVGGAAGMTASAPATAPSGAAAVIAGIVLRAIDTFGNVLGTAAGHRTEIVRCTAAVSDNSTLLPTTIASFDGTGVASMPPLLLGRPRVGRLIVSCTARSWLAAASTTVVPGEPHRLVLATKGQAVPPSWTVGTVVPRILVPNVTLAIADAAGNLLTGPHAARLPTVVRASWTNVGTQPYRVVPTATTSGRTTAGFFRFGADVTVQGVYDTSVVLTFAVADAHSKVLPLALSLRPDPCTSDGSAFAMPNTTRCAPCPAFAVCDGSSLVVPAKDAWRSRRTAYTFYDCAPPHAAAACTVHGSCDLGYYGPLCSVCEAGYGRSGASCRKCTTSSWYNWGVTAAIVVTVGVVVWLLAWHSVVEGRDPTASKHKATLAAKALLSHLQLSGIAGAAALDLPGSLRSVFRQQEEAGSPFSFNLAFFSCEFAPRHEDRLFAADALCGAVIAVVMLLHLCAVVIKYSVEASTHDPHDARGAGSSRAVARANRKALLSDQPTRNVAPRGTTYYDASLAFSLSGASARDAPPDVRRLQLPRLSATNRTAASNGTNALSTPGPSRHASYQGSPRDDVMSSPSCGPSPRPRSSPRPRPPPIAMSAFGRVVRRALQELLECVLVAIVVLTFLAFPALFELAGSAFRCETFDYGAEGTRRFLAADRSYDCDTGEHIRLVRDAALHLAALGFALPALTVATVVAMSRLLYGGSMTKARALFFYITGGYTTDRWWWEAVILARKALVLVATFAVADPVLRVYGMIWVVSGAAILAAVAQSFDDPLLALLERLSLLCVAVTLNASLLFAHAGDGAVFWLLVVLIVAVNVAVAAVCLYIFAASSYATVVRFVPSLGGFAAAFRLAFMESRADSLVMQRAAITASLAAFKTATETETLRVCALHVHADTTVAESVCRRFSSAAKQKTPREAAPLRGRRSSTAAAFQLTVDRSPPLSRRASRAAGTEGEPMPDALDMPAGIAEFESAPPSPLPTLVIAPPEAVPAVAVPTAHGVTRTPDSLLEASARSAQPLVCIENLGLLTPAGSLREPKVTLKSPAVRRRPSLAPPHRGPSNAEEQHHDTVRELLRKHRRDVLASRGAGYFLDNSQRRKALFAEQDEAVPDNRCKDVPPRDGRRHSSNTGLWPSLLAASLQGSGDNAHIAAKLGSLVRQWPPPPPALRGASAHFLASHAVVTGGADESVVTPADLETFYEARIAVATTTLAQLRAERETLNALFGVSETEGLLALSRRGVALVSPSLSPHSLNLTTPASPEAWSFEKQLRALRGAVDEAAADGSMRAATSVSLRSVPTPTPASRRIVPVPLRIAGLQGRRPTGDTPDTSPPPVEDLSTSDLLQLRQDTLPPQRLHTILSPLAVTSGAVSPMAISATTAAPTPCYMRSSPAKAPTPQRFSGPTPGGEAWDFAEKELAVSFGPCPGSLPSFAVHLAQRTPHDDAPFAMHALPAHAVATVPLPAVFSGYSGGCRVSGSHAGHGPGPYDGVLMEESHDSVHPEASTRPPPAVVLAEVPSAMFHDDEASVSGADEQPAAPAPPRRMSLAPQHVGAFLDDVLVIDNALDLEEDAEEAEEEEPW